MLVLQVLLQFTIAAGIALAISASLILLDIINRSWNGQWAVIAPRLLNGYSDQLVRRLELQAV
jgi:hypothetical protein